MLSVSHPLHVIPFDTDSFGPQRDEDPSGDFDADFGPSRQRAEHGVIVAEDER